MKKITISLALLLISIGYNAQVGVNTDVPNSTLDVKEKRTAGVNDTSAKDGVMIPKLTKTELASKTATAYTAAQNGTIIYVSDATGGATGTSVSQVTNITATGFYYLDGAVWKRLDTDTNTNLYNIDGTLSNYRIVNQGTNTLTFQDSFARTTSSNPNSIIFGQNATTGIGDQNPLMVLNSANRKVGVNTRTPRVTFDIFAASFATPEGADGILIPKMTVAELSTKNLNVYQARSTHPSNSGQDSLEGTLIYIFPDSGGNVIPQSTSPAYPKIMEVTKEGLYYYGIDDKWHPVGANVSTNLYNTNGSLSGNRIVTQGANTLAFTASGVNAFSVDGTTLSVDAANDRVGVGTAAPTSKLHVVGDAKITTLPASTASSTPVYWDSATGQVQSYPGNKKPFNKIKYTINTATSEDWVSNFDTGISTTNYTIIITSATFGPRSGLNKGVSLTSVNNAVPVSTVYTFIAGGTWHIYADYPEANPSASATNTTNLYKWDFDVMIIDNNMVKGLATITATTTGNTVTLSPPPDL